MEHRRAFGEGEIVPVPHPRVPSHGAGGFLIWPAVFGPGANASSEALQEIYRAAYEQAAMTARPAWHERGLIASWN